MSLQEFEARISEIESKYQKKFSEQNEQFRKEFQEQQDKFDRLYSSQQTEFNNALESLKKTTIDNLFRESKEQKPKPNLKSLLDDRVDPELYAAFDKKPYVITKGDKKNTVHVLVPKFKGDFQVGWLKDEIGEYYRYEVNQYGIFFGDVPQDILNEIQMPEPINVTVSGNHIFFNPEDKAKIKRQLPKFTTDWTDSSARITQGHEFDIISEILESGHVPFEKIPVEKQDMQKSNNIILRDYQEQAWKTFLKTGAIGVFHPTGSGKSFIGMKGLETIKVGDRRNLIISPRTTLVEQWNYYLEKNIPHVLDNVLITTYQGFKNFNEEFGLTLYDECQALPAHNFSRLSTINTKYRMGLSATPFREDNKNHLIITLTGYPENINWPKYMKEWGPGYHPINVHVVANPRMKLLKAYSLYNPKKRTMFYSYGIPTGKTIADKYNIPHIHGDTENRMEVMASSHSFVASSVFTEGISIQDLDHIIEVEFHFGSRREELQLTGRLMHSKSANKRHDIIMTDLEFQNYKKRILVLEEKGFHVKIEGGF
ncbi:MAG: hypothetical protein K5785_00830 [Nitrosarchaeum sp.]|nr:hypothetical protein [Nitrosarchaeum sp.]